MSNPFARIEVLDESQVSKFCHNLPGPILVSGPSGSGKSYFLTLLTGHSPSVDPADRSTATISRSGGRKARRWSPISLDTFGFHDKGRWYVNVKSLLLRLKGVEAKNVVCAGVSDNLLEVMKALKPKTIIMLDPPFSMFKQVMRLKFRDGIDKNIRSSWLDGYAVKSLFQPDDKIKYFASKASQLRDEMTEAGGVEIGLRIRVISMNRPQAGWHESWYGVSARPEGKTKTNT